MNVILTYKPRGEDKHKSLIGSITFDKNIATFKGTEHSMGHSGTYLLEKAELRHIGDWPEDNVMRFTGMMNGWPMEWITQTRR